MTVETVAERWLAHLSARNRLTSEHTRRAYRGDLNRWAKAMGTTVTDLTVTDLTAERIEAALITTADRYSPSTRDRMITVLRNLCAYATHHGHLDDNPFNTSALTATRRTQPLPRHFTDNDLARIHTAVCIPPARAHSRWTVLDRALFATLVGTGTRASELCALTVNDVIDGTPHLLHIIGKGNRMRRVPLDKHVTRLLDAWLDTRDRMSVTHPEFAPHPNTALFIDRNARPLTGDRLAVRVRSWLTQANVIPPPGAVVHAFRHTFAYQLVRAGVDLPTVQALLGHQDISTTSVYLTMTAADRQRAVEALDLGTLFQRGR